MKSIRCAIPGAMIVNEEPKPLKRAAFGAGDLAAMMLLAATPLFAALPRALLGRLCKGLSLALPSSFHRDADPAMIEHLAGLPGAKGRVILRKLLEARLYSLAMFLNDLVWKRGYEVEVEGVSNIEQALKQGRGAVLWFADFVYSSDVAKQALYRVGHPSNHLSRPEHGFSRSAFGIRHLNPIRVRAENRYLAGRIVYERGEPATALGLMADCLRRNRLVSMVACAYEGHSFAEVDLFDARLRVATGAPRLAFTEGAPLLPVFIRPAPSAPYFVVTIGEPLTMAAQSRDVAILEAVKDFVARLRPQIMEHPHLWRGWTSLVAKEDAVSETPAWRENVAATGGLNERVKESLGVHLPSSRPALISTPDRP